MSSKKSRDPSEVTVVDMHLTENEYFFYMENSMGVVVSFWRIGAYGLTACVFRENPDFLKLVQ